MMAPDLALLMTLLGASPVGFLDSHYEGVREFVRGATSCSTQAEAISVDVGSDGGVRADVATLEGQLRFFGTVAATGRLFATSRSAGAAEFVRLEGAFTGDRFEGLTQSKNCQYKVDLRRR